MLIFSYHYYLLLLFIIIITALFLSFIHDLLRNICIIVLYCIVRVPF